MKGICNKTNTRQSQAAPLVGPSTLLLPHASSLGPPASSFRPPHYRMALCIFDWPTRSSICPLRRRWACYVFALTGCCLVDSPAVLSVHPLSLIHPLCPRFARRFIDSPAVSLIGLRVVRYVSA